MAIDPTVSPTRTSRSDVDRSTVTRTRRAAANGVASDAEAAVERSVQECEEAYRAAEQRWREALKAANGGKPAALAELALAQEEYLSCQRDLDHARERDEEQRRRMAEMRARRVAVESRLAVILSQEERWRDVAHAPEKKGMLSGLRRVLRLGR